MIKAGQKYIFNGSPDDPNNGDTVTVLPGKPINVTFEDATANVFPVIFDEAGFISAAFESELSNVPDTDAEI